MHELCVLRIDLSDNIRHKIPYIMAQLFSNYTFNFSKDDKIDIDTLGFGYSIGAHGYINKNLYIKIREGTIYTWFLEYLKHNIHSIFASNVIRIVPTPTEAVIPRLLYVAHMSLKNLDKVIYEKDFNSISVKTRFHLSSIGDKSLDDELSDKLIYTLAIVFAGLTSGIHRQALSYKQVAVQTLVDFFLHGLNKGVNREFLINLVKHMLTPIIIDTYLWLPYTLYVKTGAYASELVYSIAAQPVADIIEKMHCLHPDKLLYKMDIAVDITYKNLHEKLIARMDRAKINDLANDIIKVIKETLNQIININIKFETLIGRIAKLMSIINNKWSSNAGEDKILVVHVTEQFGPLLLNALLNKLGYDVYGSSKAMDNIKIYVIYTPQVLFHTLFTLPYLGSYNARIIPILIPSTEGMLVKVFAEKFVDKILSEINRPENIYILLQGTMTHTLPFYKSYIEGKIPLNNIVYI